MEIDSYNQSVLTMILVGSVLGGVNRVAHKTENFKRSSQLILYVDNKTANVQFVLYAI